MDVSHVGRAARWSITAGSSAPPEKRSQVAAEDNSRAGGSFVRGAIIGLIIVAPFWAWVAWVVRGMLR